MEPNQPRRPLVLVIDDDVDLQWQLAEILERDGYQVVSASDGREALTLLDRGLEPEVILLDVMMPVMDGWHFLSARLASPAVVATPIIMMSAELDNVERARRAGVATVLRKPFRKDRLLGQLEAVRRASAAPEAELHA